MRSLQPWVSAALLVSMFAQVREPAIAQSGLPSAVGGATFTGFRDTTTGRLDASCAATFSPYGSATCNGQVFYAGGNAGPGFHVTGSSLGIGVAFADPATDGAPTAKTTLDLSGGDATSGGGSATVATTLTYYFGLTSIGTPPSLTTAVPVDVTSLGSVTGAAPSIWSGYGYANTTIGKYSGEITGGGTDLVVVNSAPSGGTFQDSYFNTHTVLLGFNDLQPPVVEIDLSTECQLSADAVGNASGTCTATADPVVGFDQAAFDAAMGPSTYKLSDYWQINLSSNLPAAVPLPNPLLLLGMGFGVLMLGYGRRRGVV